MMEVRPNQSSEVPAPEQPPDQLASPAPGAWAQRLLLGTEAAIAAWTGILVFLIPWTHLWTDNRLLVTWPALHSLINLTFVRGMISGVGLLDIWMGVADALRLRER